MSTNNDQPKPKPSPTRPAVWWSVWDTPMIWCQCAAWTARDHAACTCTPHTLRIFATPQAAFDDTGWADICGIEPTADAFAAELRAAWLFRWTSNADGRPDLSVKPPHFVAADLSVDVSKCVAAAYGRPYLVRSAP